MRKWLLILLNLIIFVLAEAGYKDEAVVKITADVLQPITIKKISDVDFGTIIAGDTDIKAKQNGKIEISGNGNIKLEWKADGDSRYKSVKEFLEVPIYNENSKKIITEIFLGENKGSMVEDVIKFSGLKSKEITIKGRINKLPIETESGKYSGGITIRATYEN